MAVPISNVTRRQVYAPSGAGGAGPYAFTFEILANTDIAVYKDDVLLTLTTHYTVTINANGTGSVTITAGGLALAPASPSQYAIVGNRTISRTTDFTTGGDFFANTLNDELDQQTIFNQQNAEGLQRALAAPQTDPTSINMTLPRAALRANKALGFDANGNPVISDTLGTNRGNWAAGVLYYVRDIVKDTTNNNIWQCLVQHTSSGSQPINTNADSAKWSLLVDAASATTSANNAASSASAASTSASNASTSASNASTSASNASTSASNAASSASAASTSASNAAASYDSFDDRYLGSKSSAPSVDNDGNSLLTGAIYWDTALNQMRVWSGTAWVNINASASNTRTAITATAGQTVLTVATYTPGTNTMVVYVNGVKLNASEYTETNATTVTVTTGLALNDEVEVFSYRVNEIGTLGASSVTIADTGNYYAGGNVETALQEAAQASTTKFIQAGTGAVTLTAQDKMRERRTPQDFSAVGDWNGVSGNDDTAELQALLNAHLDVDLGGPDKNYKISAALVLRTGHNILARSAKITQTANNTETFNYEAKTDITVDGVHFVGVGTDHVDSDSSRAVAIFGSGGEARIKVINNRFTNFGYTSLRAKGATDVEFCNNIVVGPGAPILTPVSSGRNYGMLADSGCYRVLASGNNISKCAQGFRIEGCQDTRIVGNVIHSIVGQHGVYAGAALLNLVVADNTIGSVDLIGIKVQAQNGYADNINITITGNTITAAGDQGILLCNGAGGANQAVKVKNATVVGNTLRSISATALNIQNVIGGVIADNSVDTAGGSGVNLSACDYVNVCDNVILSTQYTGIRDQAACNNIIVDGNRLHNVAQLIAANDAYGVYFADAGSNITISHNIISDANAKMVYGIFTPGGDQTTFSVFGNSVLNATGAAARYKNGTDAMRVCRDNFLAVASFNDTALPTVASASTISLPSASSVVRISGTTQINYIVPSGHVGKIVTLLFVDGCTVPRNGSNMLISSTFAATANDTLTICTDGDLWYEIARASN